MKKLLEEHIRDFSDDKSFRFEITCEECGRAFSNGVFHFSKAGVAPPTEEKRIIYEALYRREKHKAMQSAILYAGEHFSRCPICGRLICDDCFLICEDLEMCRSCAARLKEQGTPVSDARDIPMAAGK